MLQIAYALDFSHQNRVAHCNREFFQEISARASSNSTFRCAVSLESIFMFVTSTPAQRELVLGRLIEPNTIEATVAGQRFLMRSASKTHTTDAGDKLHKAGFTARIGEWGFAYVHSSSGTKHECLGARRRRAVPMSAYQSPQSLGVTLTEPAASMQAPKHLSLLPHLDDAALKRVQRAGFSPFAADVWSFGVQLFVARAGRLPWTAAAATCKYFRSFLRSTQPEVLGDELNVPNSELWQNSTSSEKHADRSTPLAWQWPAGFSPALVHLLSSCLRFREYERPTIKQVLKHEWFLNPQWDPPTDTPGQALERLRLPALSNSQSIIQRAVSDDAAASSSDDQSSCDCSDVPPGVLRTHTLPFISGTPRSGSPQGDSDSATSGEETPSSRTTSLTTALPRAVRWAASPRADLIGYRYTSAEDTDPA